MRRTGGATALPQLGDAGRWIAHPLERGSQPERGTKRKQIGDEIEEPSCQSSREGLPEEATLSWPTQAVEAEGTARKLTQGGACRIRGRWD